MNQGTIDVLAEQEAILKHYGVKGMHWGIRHDKPSTGRRRSSGSSLLQQRVSLGASGDSRLSKTKDSDIHKPIRNDLMNVFSNSINTIGLEERNRAYQQAHVGDFPSKKGSWSADKDMAVINPIHKQYESEKASKQLLLDTKQLKPSDLEAYGSTVNCATCSIAYNLRRDGYDVKADASVAMSYLSDNLNVYYPGATWIDCADDDEIKKATEDFPDGSHGVVRYQYEGLGVGHAIAWEKEDGQLVYRDCQVNESYTELQPSAPITGLRISRLDDKTPDLRAIHDAGSVVPSRDVKPVVSEAVNTISDKLDTAKKAAALKGRRTR